MIRKKKISRSYDAMQSLCGHNKRKWSFPTFTFTKCVKSCNCHSQVPAEKRTVKLHTNCSKFNNINSSQLHFHHTIFMTEKFHDHWHQSTKIFDISSQSDEYTSVNYRNKENYQIYCTKLITIKWIYISLIGRYGLENMIEPFSKQ